MSDNHSMAQPAQSKPAKPSKAYAEFLLFPHAAGVWATKVRGQLHYSLAAICSVQTAAPLCFQQSRGYNVPLLKTPGGDEAAERGDHDGIPW